MDHDFPSPATVYALSVLAALAIGFALGWWIG